MTRKIIISKFGIKTFYVVTNFWNCFIHISRPVLLEGDRIYSSVKVGSPTRLPSTPTTFPFFLLHFIVCVVKSRPSETSIRLGHQGFGTIRQIICALDELFDRRSEG